MKGEKKRPNNLGYLFVVGGPGGSGSSTISKMLARKYDLRYVYGGGLMRQMAKDNGYESLDDFLDMIDRGDRYDFDREIDKRLIKVSFQPNVLIDSKIFAALAMKYRISTTVTIWLNCDVEIRALRSFSKDDKKVDVNSEEYEMKLQDLKDRFANDAERYRDLYRVDYSNPKLYNDIVIDSSKLNAVQTFNLIVKALEDGNYLK